MFSDNFFKIKPWQHQIEGIKQASDKQGFAFFFQVGTGKTSTCINTLRLKYQTHGQILKTLILAPPIILENWKREFLMHSNIGPKSIEVLYGSQKERCQKMKSMGEKIVITNYESLTMKELLPLLKEWMPQVLVLDESHRLKDIKAGRTKAAIALSDIAHYKYLLTGTPILNNLMDIFTQFRILDNGRTFGQNFFGFRGRFFIDKNAGMPKQKYYPNWQPRQGAAEEINQLIKRKSMYVSKEDCLDLPPLVRQTIEVPLSPAQDKVYQEMKRDFIAFIESKAAVAELAIVKALRLQQIVSGFVNVEEGGGERSAHRFDDTPREKALKELLSDITPAHKVLVWAVFKENYATIRKVCEELSLDYVEITGERTQKEKLEAVERMQKDPKCRVLIGHPGSGGIGVTLTAASYMIFFSRSFSLEYDIQAEARCYRGGSEIHSKITRVDLVASGTIDEQVLKSLASKQNIGMSVLQDWVSLGI